MWLKCIGGKYDGRVIDIPYYLRNGDLWRIPEYPKLSGMPFNFDDPPKTIEQKYYEYVINQINFTDEGIIRFLIPKDMSCYAAILELFENHKEKGYRR